MIEVFEPGQRVRFQIPGYGEDVPGVVSAVCLRGRTVSYEVVWWDGRTRKQEWVADFEIVGSGDARSARFGFAGHDHGEPVG